MRLVLKLKGLTSWLCKHRRDAAPVREDIFEIGNEGMSVTELSQKLALPPGEVVKTLFMKGIMVQVNQVGTVQQAFVGVCFGMTPIMQETVCPECLVQGSPRKCALMGVETSRSPWSMVSLSLVVRAHLSILICTTDCLWWADS